MIARTLPAVLFGPIAGTLVDRLDRKRIMIVADIGRGLMYAAMVFVGHLWAVYALSFDDRMPLPGVGPGARRLDAQPRPAAAARQRELDRPGLDVRHPPTRRDRLHRARRLEHPPQPRDPVPLGARPGGAVVPGRRHVRVLRRDDQPGPDPSLAGDDHGTAGLLADLEGRSRRGQVPARELDGVRDDGRDRRRLLRRRGGARPRPDLRGADAPAPATPAGGSSSRPSGSGSASGW